MWSRGAPRAAPGRRAPAGEAAAGSGALSGRFPGRAAWRGPRAAAALASGVRLAGFGLGVREALGPASRPLARCPAGLSVPRLFCSCFRLLKLSVGGPGDCSRVSVATPAPRRPVGGVGPLDSRDHRGLVGCGVRRFPRWDPRPGRALRGKGEADFLRLESLMGTNERVFLPEMFLKLFEAAKGF